jgi:hypothetical protein
VIYVRPDESFMFGTVAGTVDTDYLANWLLDGRAMYPVRRSSGGLSLTVTAPASRSVSLVAVVNHNIAGTVGISGGVTATVPAATLSPDGSYLNSFTTIAPVTASSCVMAASGTPAIVGELIVGTARTLERNLLTEPEFEMADPFEWEGPAGSLPPYDSGVADPRRLRGDVLVSDTGLEAIHAWYRSTRRGVYPSLIVPIEDINDAWLVTFRYTWTAVFYFTAALRAAFPRTRSIHRVSFEFLELPRVRWP